MKLVTRLAVSTGAVCAAGLALASGAFASDIFGGSVDIATALTSFTAITAYLGVAFALFMVWFVGPWLVRFAIGIMKRGKK